MAVATESVSSTIDVEDLEVHLFDENLPELRSSGDPTVALCGMFAYNGQAVVPAPRADEV